MGIWLSAVFRRTVEQNRKTPLEIPVQYKTLESSARIDLPRNIDTFEPHLVIKGYDSEEEEDPLCPPEDVVIPV